MKRSQPKSALLVAAWIVASAVPGTCLGQTYDVTAEWLDRPLANWNILMHGIPKAPASPRNIEPLCKSAVRHPSSIEDQALAAAGWLLFGPEEKFGSIALVSALANMDGMCRPWQYQGFVFVKGRFVGTLSPRVMYSRTDGSESEIRLVDEHTVTADFERYKPSDPLCCPWRITRVTYSIQSRNGGSVLVPTSAYQLPR